MSNRVCEILGIEKPIICGPMAWVSNAPLVAAVSNAGGLGVLGVAFTPIDFALAQIEETRKLTDKPFAINVMIAPQIMENVTELIKMTKVPVVYADTLDALDEDLARKYFDLWHAEGTKIVVKVGDVASAKLLENAGADVIVAKGWEAGGHVSYVGTMPLIPAVKDAVKAPVVASGGIADGRGMAASFALGAEGIEMGTAFMVAAETPIHDNAKQALVKAGEMDAVLVGICTGSPCRQLKNNLSEKMTALEANSSYAEAAAKFDTYVQGSLRSAMVDGDVTEKGAVMCGQNMPLITKIRPAQEIIDSILEECREILSCMSEVAL